MVVSSRISAGMCDSTDRSESDPGAVDPMKIEMATAELDMITDVL